MLAINCGLPITYTLSQKTSNVYSLTAQIRRSHVKSHLVCILLVRLTLNLEVACKIFRITSEYLFNFAFISRCRFYVINDVTVDACALSRDSQVVGGWP